MNRCELCQGPTDSIGLCYNQTCRNYRGNPILQPEPSIESKVRILTPCPACNSTTLFVSDNGKLCCSLIGCPNPLAINEVANERDQLKESLLRLIEAERQFRFCGVPEMKTVDDVITGMRNIGDKLHSVVLAADLKELKDAAQGVCGYLITLSSGHVTFESPVPPENLKRLEAALSKA